MRNVGDLSWLNRYIGKPYKWGGRTIDGVDCYGLVKLIYAEQYQRILPDWVTDEIDLKDRGQKIEDVVCSGVFTEMEEPANGDIAVCYRTKLAHHIGIFYGGGVIHCEEGLGVRYEPRAQFEAKFVKVIYGDWS